MCVHVALFCGIQHYFRLQQQQRIAYRLVDLCELCASALLPKHDEVMGSLVVFFTLLYVVLLFFVGVACNALVIVAQVTKF